jgi:hypothetical protein
MRATADLIRQQLGLIESALPSFAPMQGQRNDDIETLLAGQRTRQQPSQRRGERLDSAVLEKMNQLAQFVLIESERVCCIEPADPSAAERTTALIVQREAAQKRRAALDAIVFRGQRLRLGQASAAYRHARKICQRLIADPAIVGEEQGKKGSGDLSSGIDR